MGKEASICNHCQYVKNLKVLHIVNLTHYIKHTSVHEKKLFIQNGIVGGILTINLQVPCELQFFKQRRKAKEALPEKRQKEARQT